MSSPLAYGHVQLEDGSLKKVLLTQSQFFTHAEARAAAESLPEGRRREDAMHKVSEAENQTAARVMGGALQTAAKYDNELIEVEQMTDAQTAQARDLIDQLNKGSVTASEAAKVFDQIVRQQERLNKRLPGIREGVARLADHYAEPTKAHDALVKAMPILRDGRPLASF